MPPEASTSTCGCAALRALAAALSSAGGMLSSITMSAPAAAASRPSFRSRASTSIFAVKPAAVLATSTAFVIEPACHTWLSLSMTIWERSSLWVAAPPTSRAYFSTMRKPGVVLRVPATWPAQPSASAAARAWRAADATPEARASAFKAVRSPSNKRRAGPLTVATLTLPLDVSMSAPSSTSQETLQPPIASKVASKKGTPAKTPEDLHHSVASVCVSPTTNPPTSSDGQSSRSQPATVSR
mmetsp:Transcript_1337/g.4004  ORF Transcript_1337/g.4004 Transcript_1337/m.4004 type:complete len:241 (-) Transcript_1337:202-924(-)